MCQTDSFQWDPDFIPRAIKFSAKQLKPICLLKPDFNYYSIILCLLITLMFTLHIPKNTGFIYFRKNEPSAKIHIATGAYRKKSQSDSTGNTLKASCPNLLAQLKLFEKKWKKNPKSHCKNLSREYYRKEPNYWNAFSFKFYFLQTLSTRIL